MRLRMLLLPALLLGAGCNDGAGPVRLVAGEWGGANITLTAGPQRVTVALACAGLMQFTGAIAPNASGDFELRNGSIGGGPAGNPRPATVSGHVSGDQMTLVVSIATPPGTTDPRNATYTLQRGAVGVTTIFCLTQ